MLMKLYQSDFETCEIKMVDAFWDVEVDVIKERVSEMIPGACDEEIDIMSFKSTYESLEYAKGLVSKLMDNNDEKSIHTLLSVGRSIKSVFNSDVDCADMFFIVVSER